MIGPALAIGILGLALASLIPHIIRSRREDRELERVARCGPGCICAGENLRARQQTTAPIIIQQPQPMAYQQPQVQPQIIVIQALAPQPMMSQVIYLPAQAPQYLPASTPTYQPQPQPTYAPQSYYAGPVPHVEDHQPDVYRLPPAQPVGQLPPARASDIEEARRRWERECEEMKR